MKLISSDLLKTVGSSRDNKNMLKIRKSFIAESFRKLSRYHKTLYKMKRDWFDLIIKIIIWILVTIIIVLLIMKIAGKSPSTDVIFGMILGLLCTGLVNLFYKLGKLESTLTLITKQFSALAKDFKEHVK